jgi:tetratricopeptide (TPR) repeat protein
MAKITAGQLFELLRPVSFALSVLLSAWVLASARRSGYGMYQVVLWTGGAFLFPLIVFPAYLIARIWLGRRVAASTPEAASPESESESDEAPPVLPRWRYGLPLAYAALVLTIGAAFFYVDSRSAEEQLARASRDKLMNLHDRSAREYRAALKEEDDPHTHDLLAGELAAGGRWEEALAEYRAAVNGGEPDGQLPYKIARALDALHRPDEANQEYRKFSLSPSCKQALPDERCQGAEQRAQGLLTDK